MSQGTIVLNVLSYNDATASNQPLQRDIDWRQEWDVDSFTYATDTTLSLTFNAFTKINLPSSAVRWLMILTDDAIDVRVTSKTGGFSVAPTPPSPWNVNTTTGTWVAPMTTDGTVKDGVFFMRGLITDLYIGVPSTTVNAGVKIFVAY